VKWKRAEGTGTKGERLLKKAWVKGSKVEAKSRSGDSEAEGIDMGAWVTQDLLAALLRILMEMAKQSEIMQRMLQDVSRIDLASQVEGVCLIGSGGVSVERTQEARLRSVRVWEMESRGHALEELERS